MNSKKKGKAANITKEKLAGTPFNSAAEMNAASEEIRREAWNQLERARIKRELLTKEEYKFFLEPFKKGMSYKYIEKDENLVRVFLGENGVEVCINEEMKTTENNGALLSALLRSTSDSLFSNYLKSIDIITDSDLDSESLNENEPRRKKRSKEEGK